MPRNVLQTLTIVALVSATVFVAHNFVRYILRVDGGFSQWTEFSECTRSCGTGTRFRTRTCDNPAPKFGGNDCTVLGEDSQTFRCNMNPCPVDGGYGPWSKFGECSVTCGNGVQKRERSCDSPAPMFDGLSCDKLELGPSIGTKECRKGMCPVDGGYGPWGEFGVCSVSCGGGVRQRERQCNHPEPKYSGKTCEEQELGPSIETQSCNVEQPCPVDGGYGPWGEFGECTVTCGGGVRQRERPCNNPEPKYLGKTCEDQQGLGPSIETESCNADPCPVDGGYGPWGEFGVCSVSCGGGVRQRERQCSHPEPKYSGKTCEEQELGPSIETQSCNVEEPCPGNGGYTEWSEFSECSVTCGGGVRERTRECTNPALENSGQDCEKLGPAKESEICNTEACPTEPLQDQGKDSKEDGNKEQANEEEKREEKEKEQGNKEEDGVESERVRKKRENNKENDGEKVQ